MTYLSKEQEAINFLLNTVEALHRFINDGASAGLPLYDEYSRYYQTSEAYDNSVVAQRELFKRTNSTAQAKNAQTLCTLADSYVRSNNIDSMNDKIQILVLKAFNAGYVAGLEGLK